MTAAVNPVRAFLNSYAALEVRTMTSSRDGCENLILSTFAKSEVRPC